MITAGHLWSIKLTELTCQLMSGHLWGAETHTQKKTLHVLKELLSDFSLAKQWGRMQLCPWRSLCLHNSLPLGLAYPLNPQSVDTIASFLKFPRKTEETLDGLIIQTSNKLSPFLNYYYTTPQAPHTRLFSLRDLL